MSSLIKLLYLAVAPERAGIYAVYEVSGCCRHMHYMLNPFSSLFQPNAGTESRDATKTFVFRKSHWTYVSLFGVWHDEDHDDVDWLVLAWFCNMMTLTLNERRIRQDFANNKHKNTGVLVFENNLNVLFILNARSCLVLQSLTANRRMVIYQQRHIYCMLKQWNWDLVDSQE